MLRLRPGWGVRPTSLLGRLFSHTLIILHPRPVYIPSDTVCLKLTHYPLVRNFVFSAKALRRAFGL